MNGAPHTHELVIREFESWFKVEYGDQTAAPDWPIFGSREKKMERVARRLIKQHDYQSWRAQKRVDMTGKVIARFNDRLLNHGRERDRWGSDVMNEP